jgi:RimJ/RimL family protein N-acetyltransferase
MDFLPDYPIATQRLRLRPFTRGDVESVYAYRSREDVTRYLFDDVMSREAVADAIHARVGQERWTGEGDKIFLAVERGGNSVMMGEVSLILRSADSLQAEVGYIFHPDYHGHGYATEAARALLALAFGGAGAHRVYARCHPENISSWKVMERLGMRREAHFREHVMVKGGWDEEYVYAILDHEWRASAGVNPK